MVISGTFPVLDAFSEPIPTLLCLFFCKHVFFVRFCTLCFWVYAVLCLHVHTCVLSQTLFVCFIKKLLIASPWSSMHEESALLLLYLIKGYMNPSMKCNYKFWLGKDGGPSYDVRNRWNYKRDKIKLEQRDGGLMMRNAVIGLRSTSFFGRLKNCPQPDITIPSQWVFPKKSWSWTLSLPN